MENKRKEKKGIQNDDLEGKKALREDERRGSSGDSQTN